MARGGVGGSGGAGRVPFDASCVLIDASPSLPDARILTAGSGISIVDGGPGGPVTIISSGSDADAWHKTGDSFGGDGILGTLDDHDVLLYANNNEAGKITGGAYQDLLIGSTSFHGLFGAQNALGTFRRDQDQTSMIVLWNDHPSAGPATNLSLARMAVTANVSGHYAAVDFFNSGYQSHSGANADSGAFWTYGGAVTYGCHDNFPIYFVNDQITSATLAKYNSPPFATFPYADAILFDLISRSGYAAILDIQNESGNSDGFGSMLRLGTFSGKESWLTIGEPATSTNESWAIKADTLTISGSSGTSVRANANGADDYGWMIDGGGGGFVQTASPAAIAGTSMFNSSINISLNEAGNELNIRAKYSDGTVKNLTTPLALS